MFIIPFASNFMNIILLLLGSHALLANTLIVVVYCLQYWLMLTPQFYTCRLESTGVESNGVLLLAPQKKKKRLS